ncbi:hypothetical protein [uncultured Winogradskyella sp.]|uniref:hypothetical protein n=1 Tax=uncultured Winogradskyella sp. TaxID=395353 RepID=UPI002631F41B|nr:hypothetical protein [uncultured Winogradskyella sp.]
MSKNKNVIDVDNLKILTKPQYIVALLGGVISVTAIIVTQIVTFQDMKTDITSNKEMLNGIKNEVSEQRFEFLKEFEKLHSTNANIEGKLDVLIRK